MARSAVAQISQQDQVVASSVEQVGKHIAGRSRAESTEDALIPAQSFDLHATLARHLVQNGGQAGVLRANREGAAAEDDLRFARRLLQHGGWSLVHRRSDLRLRRWLCRDWLCRRRLCRDWGRLSR